MFITLFSHLARVEVTSIFRAILLGILEPLSQSLIAPCIIFAKCVGMEGGEGPRWSLSIRYHFDPLQIYGHFLRESSTM